MSLERKTASGTSEGTCTGGHITCKIDPLTWKNVSSEAIIFLILFLSTYTTIYNSLLEWRVDTHEPLSDFILVCDKPYYVSFILLISKIRL